MPKCYNLKEFRRTCDVKVQVIPYAPHVNSPNAFELNVRGARTNLWLYRDDREQPLDFLTNCVWCGRTI